MRRINNKIFTPPSCPQIIVIKGNNFANFKKDAGKKLGIKVKKVFLANAVEVNAVEEIESDDMLWVSEGAPFYKEIGESTGETIHVSVLGSGGVGKSALTLRFVRDFFVDHWDPTIEDAYRKQVEVDSQACQLEILDTAGQDDFESLRPQWMMDKDGYIFVYCMDKETSLTELDPFFELHEQINERKHVPIVMVANKKDLVDADPGCCQVDSERGRAVAAKYGAKYIEVSAYTGENVIETFELFVREVRETTGKKKAPVKAEKESFWKSCTIL
jgi:GTPase KRas protein